MVTWKFSILFVCILFSQVNSDCGSIFGLTDTLTQVYPFPVDGDGSCYSKTNVTLNVAGLGLGLK
jgi:hypothetical protein